jgi:hypothetical protein
MIFMSYTMYMVWSVFLHEEFEQWFDSQDEALKEAIAAILDVLEEEGPRLGRPYVDTVKGSAFTNMKELRVQYAGEPWRLLFAFDPERTAIILLGGSKQGNKRWYEENIPTADKRFAEHLEQLKKKEKP